MDPADIPAVSNLNVVENISITSCSDELYAPLIEALRGDDPAPLWPKLRNFELFLPVHYFKDCGEALIGVAKKRLAMSRASPPKASSLERLTLNKRHRVAKWVVTELRAHVGNVVVLEDAGA